jgi:hypothetical protein
MRISRSGLGMSALCVCVCLGCAGSAKNGPATVPVVGTVTLGGSPVEGAIVVFSPETGSDDGRLASQATTDKNGRFQLSTHVGGGKYKVGIAPGKYAVAITKPNTATVKDMTAPPKNLLPPKYADPKTSLLRVEVAAGQANDFPFPLKSE